MCVRVCVCACACACARSMWLAKKDKIDKTNLKRQREARSEYEAVIADIQDRNRRMYEAKLAHEENVRHIQGENRRRTEQVKID